MIRRLALCVGLLLVTPACHFGFGSAYVGQWRAREAVEVEVCVEEGSEESPQCEPDAEITRALPERSYWGAAIALPNLGAAWSSVGGKSGPSLRGEASLEILGGTGPFALGLRPGLLFEVGDRSVVSVPFTLLGHFGVNDRVSTYVGLGWSPYTRLIDDTQALDVTTASVVRGLAGVQIVLSQTEEEIRILWIFEVDGLASVTGDPEYRSVGLTTQIGVSM